MAKPRTKSYEMVVIDCERCGYEREPIRGELEFCAVCGIDHCIRCTPMGRAGLEPPWAHDANLTFVQFHSPICFGCAPLVAKRIEALLALMHEEST